MNRNRFIKAMLLCALAMPLIAFGQVKRTQCTGITTKGLICKNKALVNKTLCWQHDSTYVKSTGLVTLVCSGKKANGERCLNRTKHVTGKCHLHRD